MIRPVQAYKISNGDIFYTRDEAIRSEFANTLTKMLKDRGYAFTEDQGAVIDILAAEFRAVSEALKTATTEDRKVLNE